MALVAVRRSPALFDPVEGGSANDYDYANQDPCNTYDLDGRKAMSHDSGGGLSCKAPRTWWEKNRRAIGLGALILGGGLIFIFALPEVAAIGAGAVVAHSLGFTARVVTTAKVVGVTSIFSGAGARWGPGTRGLCPEKRRR